MEDYPSLAEGNGLENRQVGQTTQEFESLILLIRRSIGVVVISSPCHGEDRRFKSVMDRYIVDIIGSVAQSVEQWIEAPCVGGSIPSRAIH